ncbi:MULTISPECIES: DUF5336 domain-containing protein [unclassified Streptomyces]|uniref:DUF5336 domain-containing protein n=1 Tax=Streptomyces sp. R33 TaxID=3238629 RepID=A0AB39Y8V8_9ACTN|nr:MULTISPECIES: DUF5336 domain-containing protein [unclassified Streptomyces]KJY41054.1 membrane protein [Streptomyces sp. NRRL S-444]KOY59245.1 membrane protein [Streptomyces sp. XY332]TDU78441.1 hypothetical protein EDD91_5228 [Streptomyces sp. KS 21]THA32228.1 hypothetical protein E6W17_33975 [Streptomyces sp. A1547]
MNIRSLTRGDGVVIGAAVLLFIASFLDFYSATGLDLPSVWDTDVYRLALPTIFLLGFIAAGLIIAARFQPETRKLAGLPLAAWGTVLAVAAAWSSLWSLITSPSGADLGAGCIIAFLATLALAGVAVAGAKIPALAGPLVPEAKPVAPAPYGAQPQPGTGYGYPGGQQPQPYGSTPQPVPPYGGTPTPAPAPQDQAPAPAGDFTPFWFAVPVARPLFPEDGSPAPIAELAPGTWYLAVDQRGPATLIAQTQDGRRGVLNDTSGIQRG